MDTDFNLAVISKARLRLYLWALSIHCSAERNWLKYKRQQRC